VTGGCFFLFFSSFLSAKEKKQKKRWIGFLFSFLSGGEKRTGKESREPAPETAAARVRQRLFPFPQKYLRGFSFEKPRRKKTENG